MPDIVYILGFCAVLGLLQLLFPNDGTKGKGESFEDSQKRLKIERDNEAWEKEKYG